MYACTAALASTALAGAGARSNKTGSGTVPAPAKRPAPAPPSRWAWRCPGAWPCRPWRPARTRTVHPSAQALQPGGQHCARARQDAISSKGQDTGYPRESRSGGRTPHLSRGRTLGAVLPERTARLDDAGRGCRDGRLLRGRRGGRGARGAAGQVHAVRLCLLGQAGLRAQPPLAFTGSGREPGRAARTPAATAVSVASCKGLLRRASAANEEAGQCFAQAGSAPCVNGMQGIGSCSRRAQRLLCSAQLSGSPAAALC